MNAVEARTDLQAKYVVRRVAMNPAVVVPVHKPTLTNAEVASLQQVSRVLSDFPVLLAMPRSMSAASYLGVCDSLQPILFDDEWFQSFRRHQKLMTSIQFYQRFDLYSHILVYHLDAWVFRDELLQWCEREFDYIGAPWRSGYDANGKAKFVSAGNGGFSLRRVEACLKTLEAFDGRRYRGLGALLRELRFRKGANALKHLAAIPLKLAGFGNTLRHFHQSYAFTEDKFWAYSAVLANNGFRVAPVETAKEFAFEASPEQLYEESSQTLPFGCHAWRYDQPFWCGQIGLPPDLDFRPHNEDGVRI